MAYLHLSPQEIPETWLGRLRPASLYVQDSPAGTLMKVVVPVVGIRATPLPFTPLLDQDHVLSVQADKEPGDGAPMGGLLDPQGKDHGDRDQERPDPEHHPYGDAGELQRPGEEDCSRYWHSGQSG